MCAAMSEVAVRLAMIVLVLGAGKVVCVLYHLVVIFGRAIAMEPVI